MHATKEASEAKFGKGYNVLPIHKDRLNAKTLITTPNSDVIYALGYLDLKEGGAIVIDAPPGLQGILDDFRQRPVKSVGIATIPDKGFFVNIRLYAPTKPFFDQTWRPDDMVKVK